MFLSNRSNQKILAFTLVELLIAISVIAVFLTVAIPSFNSIVLDTRVRAMSNRLMASLQFVRQEAILRNKSIHICPTLFQSGRPWACAGDFSMGWLVYEDGDHDRLYNPESDKVILVQEGVPKGYSVTNKAGTRQSTETITYRPDGSAGRNRTLVICGPINRPAVMIVLSYVGRPRIATEEGICPR